MCTYCSPYRIAVGNRGNCKDGDDHVCATYLFFSKNRNPNAIFLSRKYITLTVISTPNDTYTSDKSR